MSDSEAPPTKRARSICADTEEESPLEVFSKDILSNPEKYATAYSEAKPYSHGLLKGLFVDGFAGE